jgi:very-short-patch-repair endonuclease
MRLYDIKGRLRSKNVSKYLIDWNKKSRSKIQFTTKKFLETRWRKHIVFEEFPVYGTRMKVDILNATIKVAIEVQGNQHSSFNKFFHGNSRAKYLESIKRDVLKSEWLSKNNYKLIEVEENEIKLLSEDFFLKKFGLKF